MGVMHPGSPRRWINDVGRYRLSVENAIKGLRLYRYARSKKYSQTMSARYAIVCMERNWHSGGTIDLIPRSKLHGKPRWMTTTRIDTSKKRFIRLLRATFRYNVTWKDLDSGTDPWKWIKKGYKDSPTRTYQLALRAVQNVRTIYGSKIQFLSRNSQRLSQAKIDETLLWRFFFYADIRKEWLKCRRGRDLFVLWPFNIPEAISEADGTRATMWYVVSPNEISARAYGIQEGMLRHILHYRQLTEYIKRWRDWFRAEDRLNITDEIYIFLHCSEHWSVDGGCGVYPEYQIDQSMHPECLLRICRQFNEAYHRREGAWQRRAPARPQPKPEDTYIHHERFKEYKYKDYTLRPIMTYGRLKMVGESLHNCAATYHYPIVDKESVLVEMADADDKPIALGQWKLQHENGTGQWMQISKTCNKRPDKFMSEAFKGYEQQLMTWVEGVK
jgi:hypothetical protein